MFLKSSRLFSLAIASSLITGCATPYVPAKPLQNTVELTKIEKTPDFFHESGQPLPFESEWWLNFTDPFIADLVKRALEENKQLEIAQANIEIAQAGLNRSSLEKSYDFNSNAGLPTDRNARFGQEAATSFVGGLSARWEWDAFGRIASSIKAANLSVEAARHARQDVAVTVASETALAYIDLRGAQARLQVAKDNADIQSQSLSLLQDLLNNGRATQLDVSRAEAQYRTTLASLPEFQATIDSAVNRLSVLTGQSASNAENDLRLFASTISAIPEIKSSLIAGTPEGLIRRRPDIRQAETDIARRLALSDVERASLFPTLSFDGNLLAVFNKDNRIDRLSSFGFSFGPALNWEGPDLRRVRADISASDAQTKQAYVIYEQTVLQAISDVETALSDTGNEIQRREDLIKAAKASRIALELARLRFDEGLDDFLDVLEAQRTLLDNEDRLTQSRLRTTRLAILTYRELGGITPI